MRVPVPVALLTMPQEEIEIGRQAQAALEDPSLPWNITASHTGSRQSSVARNSRHQIGIGGFPSSVGALHSSAIRLSGIRPGSLERRTSRIPSASPLVGRGQRQHNNLHASQTGGDDFPGGGTGELDIPTLEEFELYGPSAAVDTQTAAESQWVRATLTQESSNFLDFVNNEISNRLSTGDQPEDGGLVAAGNSITLEELLPPEKHSKIVAAQAFYHILALSTASQLQVNQEDDFGPIHLSTPEGVTSE